MAKRVNCPACGCDVTDRVQNAAAVRLSKRMNRQHVDRVAKLLIDAESGFDSDPRRQSAGQLWRQDVRAIRYVFNRLMACQSDEPAQAADAVDPVNVSARWQELFWALPSGEMRSKLRALEIDMGRWLQMLNIPVWKCKACGCQWRDNLDATVSLLDAHQKSCPSCELSPTKEACEIHWIALSALSRVEDTRRQTET